MERMEESNSKSNDGKMTNIVKKFIARARKIEMNLGVKARKNLAKGRKIERKIIARVRKTEMNLSARVRKIEMNLNERLVRSVRN